MCLWYTFLDDNFFSNIGPNADEETLSSLVFHFHIRETIYDQEVAKYDDFHFARMVRYPDQTIYTFKNRMTQQEARLILTTRRPCMVKAICICTPSKCDFRTVQDSLPAVLIEDRMSGEMIHSIV